MQKEFCIRGHKLEGDNILWSEGSRHCRACSKIRAVQFTALKNSTPRQPKPDVDTLLCDFEEFGSYRGVGLKYGVSDNAVRKWIKRYGVEAEIQKFARRLPSERPRPKVKRVRIPKPETPLLRYVCHAVFAAGKIGRLDPRVVYALSGTKDVDGTRQPDEQIFIPRLKQLDRVVIQARAAFFRFAEVIYQ